MVGFWEEGYARVNTKGESLLLNISLHPPQDFTFTQAKNTSETLLSSFIIIT